MSRLSDLLRVVEQLDPQLAKDLDREIQPLQERLPFGLNFERHAPEAVELAGHRIRNGNKVRVLPPRGSLERGDRRLWRVDTMRGGVAEVSIANGDDRKTQSVPVEDLTLVAEFRDRIYPGLRPDGALERGGDKPFHTVINGENFHVLELLTFTHEYSVDAIYIDPPYNSGARDWKYNNDYIDDRDAYRHSKWLAFMERRLRLAKRLLKPEDSVLIVTIDEKEYLRLGLLLGQIFAEARITMVSSSINSAGSARAGSFGRSAEYLYFVQLGQSTPAALALGGDWNPVQTDNKSKLRWHGLRRRGADGLRSKSPRLFYPIFIKNTEIGPVFSSVGEPYFGDDWQSVTPPTGSTAVWPIRQNGDEGRWASSPEHLRSLITEGHARLGRWQSDRTAIEYLSDGERTKVREGVFPIVGRKADGSVVTDSSEYVPRFIPTDVWRITAHDASNSGSRLLSKFVPGRGFPFPKSLYAVEDALRFFVAGKRDAIVLDFFAGSGTTAHALMRLNKQDGGTRQCISVTNNEVSAEEQAKLRERKLRPGDPEWEQWGICDYITKPRIRAAITGFTPDGERIKGDYKFVDEFPMADGFEENVAFFTLSYESPWMVEADKAFASLAPLLWLRAGALGERIDSIEGGFAVADSYGILKDLDLASDFVAELQRRQGIRIAYVVTDDDGRYQQVASEISGIETVRLYEDYLRNCESTGDI
ncbi:DNA methyltransferase [Pseudoclavibacter helvolus]|uniref:DNA methyltransferase n=1 Tax=Pseudoclavibacter helvolus TaxID=255205 RepID=UPI003C7937EF